ncbi:hypothetical protein [Paenibacillus pectinilyticus]|nr:hypothetical protein [Paenibacillus pectinilyticus]
MNVQTMMVDIEMVSYWTEEEVWIYYNLNQIKQVFINLIIMVLK